jgi:soluble lytic murein transglycosylase-like protein
MRFCFAFAPLLVASSLPLPAASLPGSSGRTVKSVVRADAGGRLVRSVVVSPRAVRENVIAAREIVPGSPAVPAENGPAETSPPSTFREAVDQIARKHDLPPQLVHSVIRVESNYNPYAVSPKGAQGLMQLVPGTARRFGVANVFNPSQNIEGGARYLRYLLDLYRGDYRLALAAYNAGEGAVAKHRGVPPYPETVNYLQQVRKRLAEASSQQPAKKAEAKPQAAKPVEPVRIVEIVEPDGRVHYVSK